MSGKFDLSVNFSLFNGAVVLESKENFLKIGLTHFEDENLKRKLTKSAEKFFVEKGVKFSDEKIEFVSIDEETLKHEISLRYGESERENERENDAREASMLLDTLLRQAEKSGASDIHIEENRVRFRVSGILEEVSELSAEKSRELVRRIKILSNLNVLESRRGQDGQFVFEGKSQVFIRVSCIPAVSGNLKGSVQSENVVLRLLNVSRVPLSLAELGFSNKQCALLKNALKSENGLILICGATGSGKSTTAASLLTEINSIYDESKKIITIEDPPEYVLDGCTQIRVDEENGMSFSSALRFIFRQDPDVIFVGEIRDSVTARTVLQASLTGHLVFATVHTSGLRETQIRMKELGVDFSEFSSVLRGMIFQKLTFVVSDSGKNFVDLERKIHLEAEVLTSENTDFQTAFSLKLRNPSVVTMRNFGAATIPLITPREKMKGMRA